MRQIEGERQSFLELKCFASPLFQIACRSSKPLEKGVADKIAMFCHVPVEHVMAVHDCKSVYHVPLLLNDQGMLKVLTKRLGLTPRENLLNSSLFGKWKQLTDRIDRLHDTVNIVLVGKYTNLQDSYISVVKSLQHASLSCNRKLNLSWVEASDLEPTTSQEDPIRYHDAWKKLCSAGGILVPGGFGERGCEGKIAAAKWARENKIPYLGICLGMQIAVIEFARNVCGLKGKENSEFVRGRMLKLKQLSIDAHSEEIDKATPHPVVIFMPEISKTQMGGTMRLGDRLTIFSEKSKDTITRKLYGGVDTIHERHRHRYEVNPKYVAQMEEKGLQFIGQDEKGERMIMLELKGKNGDCECWEQILTFHTAHLFNSSPFRSSLLCCLSIPSRVQDTSSKTHSSIPWLYPFRI